MSCFPPEHMHFEDEPQTGRSVILYPSCCVGVNREAREVAIVLNHPKGQSAPSPALLLNEKDAAQLILQLQTSLQFVRQLPVTPYIPQD